MDDLAVYDVIESFDVWNVENANRLDRFLQRLRTVNGWRALAQLPPQDSEQPRSIEPLSIAVIAEAHDLILQAH